MSKVVIDANSIIVLSNEEIAEIRTGWRNRRGQGGDRVRELGHWCVIVENCGEEDALILSELFYQESFCVRSCCFYNKRMRILSLYCGDAGSNAEYVRLQTEAMVIGYFAKQSTKPPP